MTDHVVLDLGGAFEAVASTPIDTVDLDPEPCHGPLLEDVLSSPFLRFKQVSEHADMTPDLASVATRVFDMEVKARKNSRVGDALFAEEAKALSLDIHSRRCMIERKSVFMRRPLRQ